MRPLVSALDARGPSEADLYLSQRTQKPRYQGLCMERATRLELATFTLAK